MLNFAGSGEVVVELEHFDSSNQIHIKARRVTGEGLGVLGVINSDGTLQRQALSTAAIAAGFPADTDGLWKVNNPV